jgi:thiol-disulfide isomerase/thioredoxin
MKIFKISTLLIFLLIIVDQLLAQEKPKYLRNQLTTYITGKIDDGVKCDTLSLVLNGPFYNYGGATERGASQILTSTPDKHGVFKFKIQTGNSPLHISLHLSSKKDEAGNLSGEGDIADYLIEPGDSINVVFNKYAQEYSGKGADLFNAQDKVESIDKGDKILTRDPYDYFRKDKEKWLMQKDSLLNAQLSLLATFQSKLSPISYGIIRADVIGVNRAWIYRRISFAGPFFVAGTPLEKDLAKLCEELELRPSYINPADRSSLSPKYIHYLYEKLRTEVKYGRIIKNVNVFLDENYFSAINTAYNDIVRDKLLIYWLTSISSFNHLRPEYIINALSVMQTSIFIEMVEKLNSTFSTGIPIIDFEFKDVNDNIVHLADFKGKVLFIDLWFSGCTPCLAVAAGLPVVEKAFENRSDVIFVSIAIDKDKKTWLKSIDKNKKGDHYSYYINSTTQYLYTGGTAGNNSFIKKYVPGGSFPSLLIVDKEGKIFSSTPSQPITQQGRVGLIKEIKEALINK